MHGPACSLTKEKKNQMVCGSYGFHSRSGYCVHPLARSVECLLDLDARGPGIQTEAEAISGSVASGFHLSTLWVLREICSSGVGTPEELRITLSLKEDNVVE